MSSRRATAAWWAAGFAIWTGLALLSVMQMAIWLEHRGQPIDWQRISAARLADWYACGLFIPLLVIVTRRWPMDRRHLASRLPLHVAVLAAATLGKLALDIPLHRVLGGIDDPTYTDRLAGGGISELIAFACVAAALHAVEFYRRYRERETLALQLQARLSDAQLRALRAQLNPHFLFNTLNAATALLHRDPHAADSMLTRLGELLRLTLRANPRHETPLHEELDLLERYLAIMRTRFSDRVTIRCAVDPAVADALVPSFILQPIVENAFEHGVARLQRPGLVEIDARADDSTLVLTVRDDGLGPVHGTNGNGVGLTNTRDRLAELHGSAGTLVLTSRPGGGTLAEVRLPLHLEVCESARSSRGSGASEPSSGGWKATTSSSRESSAIELSSRRSSATEGSPRGRWSAHHSVEIPRSARDDSDRQIPGEQVGRATPRSPEHTG